MFRSPLLHFLVLGALLFIGQSVYSRVPEAPVVVIQRSEIAERLDAYRQQMGRVPSESEADAIERQVVDNALWLEQAFSLGLHEVDSVVRQRLLLNMRFLEGESEMTETELIARAIELGMDRSDTVVQRRLVDRVQAILRAGVRARELDDDTLTAHYESTEEQWREPPLLDFSHAYLSRDKRGDSTLQDAAGLLNRVRSEGLEIDAAIAAGDPFLAGHRIRGATPNRIIARLGPAFAEGVSDAQPNTWLGPVESAFGQHVVWVHDRKESHVPPLGEIRNRVYEDWVEQQSRKALKDHIERRRLQVEVRFIDDTVSMGNDATAS